MFVPHINGLLLDGVGFEKDFSFGVRPDVDFGYLMSFLLKLMFVFCFSQSLVLITL